MIVTVGSINMDLVTIVDHHPEPGETILGSDYKANPGGKGANQAVAASRLGKEVSMIGRLGTDAFGEQLLQNLKNEGVDTRWIERLELPSGVAFISVDEAGQNRIIVAPGANKELRPEVLQPRAFDDAKIVLLQLEIPLSTVREAARLGKSAGATTILNAAPVVRLSAGDYEFIDILVINEIEAGMLLKKDRPQDPKEALALATEILDLVPNVIITLGEMGAVWRSTVAGGHHEAFQVKAVDTTAAGDAFVGTLAALIAEDQPLERAVSWACAAGALATTKAGAQSSLPVRKDIELLLGGNQ